MYRHGISDNLTPELSRALLGALRREIDMKIEQVFRAVHNVRRHALRDNPNKEPKIRVYMDYDYWLDCVCETNGLVSSGVSEFYHNNTILGHDVYQVPESRGGKKHPAFEVVDYA